MNAQTTTPNAEILQSSVPAPAVQIENRKSKIQNPVQLAEPPSVNPELANLLSPPATENLSLVAPPISSDQAVARINAKPMPVPCQPRKTRRTGRVACLPKRQHDMVNRMLWNNIPYKNIVAALGEAGYSATERNISNWATGGHLEWRLTQEHVLQNRLDQDQLVDFLRRDDAGDLPEVGLQAAATRLSQVLLQKLSQADNPEANLDTYSKMVDLLCRLNREIAATQKMRDASRRTLGKEYDPIRVKDQEHLDAIEWERYYSDPPRDSKLPKPTETPNLPAIPTATFMAEQAAEWEETRAAMTRKAGQEMMRSMLAQAKAKAAQS